MPKTCTNITYFRHFKDSFEKISGNAKKTKTPGKLEFE
jgi:hypothetical protein